LKLGLTQLSVEFFNSKPNHFIDQLHLVASYFGSFYSMDFINSQVTLYPDLAEEYATLGELHEKK